MDPSVWIEDFLLAVHIAGGDDINTIKYLSLNLKGSARHWLNGLPPNSIGEWDEVEDELMANFQGTYVKPPNADNLSPAGHRQKLASKVMNLD